MNDTCIPAERNSAPLAAQRKAFGVIPSKMIWAILACCFIFLGGQFSYAVVCTPVSAGSGVGAGDAGAAPAPAVLILGSTVSNGCASLEATRAQTLNFNVEVDDDAAWGAKSTLQFKTYKAIILGDATCPNEPPGTAVGDSPVTAAKANSPTWGPAITGPVAVVGTDPAFHVGAHPAAGDLTQNAIAFAASGSGTGAYICLSCYYESLAANTTAPVDVLAPFGSFRVASVPNAGDCNAGGHIVGSSQVVAGLTDAGLSDWFCSSHEAFVDFPSTFSPQVVVAASASRSAPTLVGDAYILATTSQTVTEPLSTTTTMFPFNTPGAVTQQTIDYTNSGATFSGVTMQVTLRQISDADSNSEFQRLVQGSLEFQGSQCLHRNLGNGNFACAGTVVLCTTSTNSTPLGTNCPQAVLAGVIGLTDKYATDPAVFTDPSQVLNPGYLAASDDALSCAPTDQSCKGLKNIFSALNNDCCTTSGTTKTFNSLFVPVMGVPQPTYSFTGFFQPVDNPPTYNVVKAGSGVPVKFSLGGNFGLNIFQSGSPSSGTTVCNIAAPQDAIETTVTTSNSSLSYDPTSNQYIYVWKTQSTWAGTCRQLVINFADGSTRRANFMFKK